VSTREKNRRERERGGAERRCTAVLHCLTIAVRSHGRFMKRLMIFTAAPTPPSICSSSSRTLAALARTFLQEGKEDESNSRK
jgi:hypothetical protein